MNQHKPTQRPEAAMDQGIRARPLPQNEIPEHGTGSGACSVCQFSAGQFQVDETLRPGVPWASQRVLLLDARGNGFAYDAPSQVIASLRTQGGRAIWNLSRDPAIALPPQKVWLETTMQGGAEPVIDNVEIVS